MKVRFHKKIKIGKDVFQKGVHVISEAVQDHWYFGHCMDSGDIVEETGRAKPKLEKPVDLKIPKELPQARKARMSQKIEDPDSKKSRSKKREEAQVAEG